ERPAETPPFTTVHAARAVIAPQTAERLAGTLEGRERGLIVAGPGTDAAAADEIARLARILRWPILADPLSGLRFGSHDRSALAARLAVRPAPSPWLDDWLESSAALRDSLDDEVAAVDEVLEGKLFPILCERLPPGSLVVLGNSMPVRDADTFLGSRDRAVR